MLGERDFIVLGLFRATKRDPSKNREREDIADNNDKYAVGNGGNNEPLAEGNDDNNEYAEDGNIANDNDEDAFGSLSGQEHHNLSAAC